MVQYLFISDQLSRVLSINDQKERRTREIFAASLIGKAKTKARGKIRLNMAAENGAKLGHQEGAGP